MRVDIYLLIAFFVLFCSLIMLLNQASHPIMPSETDIFTAKKSLWRKRCCGEMLFPLYLLESLSHSRQFSLKIVIFVVIRLT